MRHRVRRLLEALVVVAAVAGLAALGRRLLGEREPRRELNGAGAILGSLDTWPPVPRPPTALRD